LRLIRAAPCSLLACARPVHARTQDKFVIDNSMHEDDSEFEYRLSLETASGTVLHSLNVAFQVRYSMVEDAKR